MTNYSYLKYATIAFLVASLLIFFNNCSKYKYTAIDEDEKSKTLSQTPVFSEPVTTPPVVTTPPTQIPVKFLCSNRRTEERGTNFIMSADKISVEIIQYEVVHKNPSQKMSSLKEISHCTEDSSNLAKEIKETKRITLNKCSPEGEFIQYNSSKKAISGFGSLKNKKNTLTIGNKYYTVIVYANNGTILNIDGTKKGKSKKAKQSGHYVEILFDINLGSNATNLAKYSTTKENQEECDRRASPLFVDLRNQYEKDGFFKLTAPWHGIEFDIMGENAEPVAHTPYKISWFTSSSMAFITLPNAEGRVLGVDQLFGDNTKGPDEQFAANGYDALAKFDENDDNLITFEDPVFEKLRIWQDHNLNGRAESNELKTLDELGLMAIDLNYDSSFKEIDSYGNAIKYKSVAKTKDGEYKLVFDIWFELNLDKAKSRSHEY